MHKNYTIPSPRLALAALGIVLLALLFFTRLYRLTEVPSVVSHDELYYAVQARTLALSGSDPTGLWRPWYFTAADPLYAELPGVVMTPFAWIFGSQPLLAAKLPFAFFGCILVLSLASLLWSWTNDARATIALFLVATFNPWLFQFSRMGFDSVFSLSFYFLGILVLIKSKGWAKLWSVLPFFLGFFQYQGLKVLFLPVVLVSCAYVLISEYKQMPSSKRLLQSVSLWPLTIVAVCSIFLMSFFMLKTVLRPDTKRATSDLLFSDRATNASLVDVDRQQAISTPYSSFFSNKAVSIGKRFVSQYLASFNPTQLFLTGEPLRNPFSVWKWGMFHILDSVLIVLGAIYLSQRKEQRWTGLFLLSLLVLAPFPSALNAKGLWVMFRSALMIPVLLLIAGFGCHYLLSHWPNWAKLGFASLYAVVVVFFLYEYFYKYPVYGTQGSYFAERLIASYVQRAPQDTKVIVLADEPQFMYEALLLFTNSVQRESLPQIQNAFRHQDYTLGNWSVRNNCFDSSLIDERTIVIASAAIPACPPSQQIDSATIATSWQKTTLPSLLDSGAIFVIHNDQVCGGFDLGRFSHVSENVFAVEKLSQPEFCTAFITRE